MAAGSGTTRRAAPANPCRPAEPIDAAARQPRRDDVGAWINGYRPRAITASRWEGPLAEFVTGCLHELHAAGAGALERKARLIARIAAWSEDRGSELDREVVFDPHNVEQFISSGLRDDPSRGTYRSTLRSLGRTLTRQAPWDPPPERVNRRSVARPYTSGEVAQLWAAAEAQETALRRRAAEAMLTLGLACGLDGRWNARVCGSDVRTRHGVLGVDVGDPNSRFVPALAIYAERLQALAAVAGDDLLIGGQPSKNRGSNLLARLTYPKGCPALEPNRLRSTWLVGHLQAGTPVADLAAAAGTAGLTTFSDLLEFVAPSPAPRAAARLARPRR